MLKLQCSKRLNLFQMAGQFVAKALLDSRIIDISFNRVFLRLVLGDTVPLTLETLMVSTVLNLCLSTYIDNKYLGLDGGSSYG